MIQAVSRTCVEMLLPTSVLSGGPAEGNNAGATSRSSSASRRAFDSCTAGNLYLRDAALTNP